MAKNIFTVSTEERKKERSGLTAKATGKPAPAKTGRVQICVSLTPEEHEKLKAYATSYGASVSGTIKRWIRENCD